MLFRIGTVEKMKSFPHPYPLTAKGNWKNFTWTRSNTWRFCTRAFRSKKPCKSAGIFINSSKRSYIISDTDRKSVSKMWKMMLKVCRKTKRSKGVWIQGLVRTIRLIMVFSEKENYLDRSSLNEWIKMWAIQQEIASFFLPDNLFWRIF